MKKTITLLLAFGVVASSFAQTSSEESRRIILGRKAGGSTSGTGTRTSDPRDIILGRDDRRNDDNTSRYPSGTYGSREQQIDQVNREYDDKIRSIRNNPTLSAAEKERMIRQLNNDRARRIKDINNRNNNNRDRRDDRDRKNDRDDRDRRYDRDDRDDDDDDDDDDKKYKKNKGNNGNHYGWEKGKGNPHKNGGHPGKGNSNKGGNQGKNKGRG